MIQFVSHVRPPSAEKACSQRRRRGPRPREAHADGPAAEGVVALKDADADSGFSEPADDRRLERPAPGVGPVDRPEPPLAVEEPQRHARHAAAELRAVDALVPDAAEQRPDAVGRLELVPARRALEAGPQLPVVDPPAAPQEIEVAHAARLTAI